MYVCIVWTWALKNLDEPVSGTCEVALYVFRSARSSAKRNLFSSLERSVGNFVNDEGKGKTLFHCSFKFNPTRKQHYNSNVVK